MDKYKKNNIRTIAGLFVGVIVMFLVQQFLFKAPSFDKEMMKVASEFNKSCPIMVDQITRCDNTAALPDKVFLFNYTIITMTKDSMDVEGLKKNLEPLIINSIKTNPAMKYLRDNQVTISSCYKDRNGVFLFEISVTLDKYKK